jgi:Tfp pilus assembly protein PilW
MDYKTISGKHARSGQCGFVLSEILVVMGISTILILAITAFTMFTGRSFAAIFNYVDLDDANRVAMDQLSRDIRQANRVTDFTTNGYNLTLETPDDAGGVWSLSYAYDPTARTLTRSMNSVSKVILRDCDTLNFDIRQRNPIAGSYDVYPVATTISTAKVIDVSWVCSRTIFGRKENTESVQTARIVIRKQG